MSRKEKNNFKKALVESKPSKKKTSAAKKERLHHRIKKKIHNFVFVPVSDTSNDLKIPNPPKRFSKKKTLIKKISHSSIKDEIKQKKPRGETEKMAKKKKVKPRVVKKQAKRGVNTMVRKPMPRRAPVRRAPAGAPRTMSRAGFLKGVGAAGAVLGAAALGRGLPRGAARGGMGMITGRAVDPGFIVGNPGDPLITVTPKNEFPTDHENVQWAVDNVGDGGTVLLKAGTFNFGTQGTLSDPDAYKLRGRVVVNKLKSLILTGETDGIPTYFSDDSTKVLLPNGTPLTKILGGYFVLLLDAKQDYVVENLHFDHYSSVAIRVNKCNVATLQNNKITNADISQHPLAPVWMVNGIAVGELPLPGYVGPGDIGTTNVKNNEIDTFPNGGPVIEPSGVYATLAIVPAVINKPETIVISVEDNEIRNPGHCGIDVFSATCTVNIRRNSVVQSTYNFKDFVLFHRDYMPPFGGICIWSSVWDAAPLLSGPREIIGNRLHNVTTVGMSISHQQNGTIFQNKVNMSLNSVDGSKAFWLWDEIGIDSPVANNDIRANQVTGKATCGFYVEGNSQFNEFTGNNLAELSVQNPLNGGALYFFGEGTHDNLVQGYTGGNNGLVLDLGENNDITGVKD